MNNIKISYERDGYIYPKNAMPEEDAIEFRNKLEKIEKTHGNMHYVVKPHLLIDWVYDIAKRKEVLDTVKGALGEDLLLWDSAFIIKEPKEYKTVGWHQDLSYFGLDAGDLVTVWIAISSVDKCNGCMEFIPGSHKDGLLAHSEYHDDNSVLSRSQNMTGINTDNAIDIVLKPGEMSLHHGWTIHASGKNETDDRRIALCLLYIKPSMKQIFANRDSAILVSGKDEFGHFDEDPLPTANFSEKAIAYQKKVDAHRKSIWMNS